MFRSTQILFLISLTFLISPSHFLAHPSVAGEGNRIRVDLGGTWKFFPAFEEIEMNHAFLEGVWREGDSSSESGKHHAWIAPGFNDSKWWDIQVPGSWNTQFEDLWSYEGEGWYRKEIDIPADWAGKRVLFHSSGALYRTVLYVNGKEAGIHEGGYTSFTFPIQDLLRFGESNTLAVAVDNKSSLDRVPMERHDWWVHGGLYRPVHLEVSQKVFIESLHFETESVGPPAKSRVHTILFNQESRVTPLTLRVTLRAPGDGAAVVETATCNLGAITSAVEIPLRVEKPLLWSPGKPVLYDLQAELLSTETGQVVDRMRKKVGIRTVSLSGRNLLLNDEPLLVKGVNRYENYPDSGMTSTPESLQQDIDLIKGIGANLVRCHYTYAPETYDVLDREGLLAVCEIPLYQWGRPGHSEKNLEAAKFQLGEMIETLRDHPSVVFWSVSNETRTRPREEGEEHRRLSDMVVRGNLELIDLAHRQDPSRPVIAPSNRWPDDPVFAQADLLSVNVYLGAKTPHVNSLPEMMETMRAQMEELRNLHPDKPILVTEFGSWGLRGLETDYFPGEIYQAALLSEYWRSFLEEPGFSGAIIWCFADSDVHRKFTTIYEMRCAYGLFDIYRRPKLSAHAIRNLWKREE